MYPLKMKEEEPIEVLKTAINYKNVLVVQVFCKKKT